MLSWTRNFHLLLNHRIHYFAHKVPSLDWGSWPVHTIHPVYMIRIVMLYFDLQLNLPSGHFRHKFFMHLSSLPRTRVFLVLPCNIPSILIFTFCGEGYKLRNFSLSSSSLASWYVLPVTSTIFSLFPFLLVVNLIFVQILFRNSISTC